MKRVIRTIEIMGKESWVDEVLARGFLQPGHMFIVPGGGRMAETCRSEERDGELHKELGLGLSPAESKE